MTKKYTDNVIQFPIKKKALELLLQKQTKTKAQQTEKELFELKEAEYDDCIYMAQLCIEAILDTIQSQEDTEFNTHTFAVDQNSKSYKDIHVILNLLVAAFLREHEIKHIMQEDLDDLLIKLRLIADENKI